MTTIACDGKIIAGDGLITGNGLIHSTTQPKVFRMADGSVVGMTGSVYHYALALAFLNDEATSLDLGDEGFEAIILHADGRTECMDGKGRRYDQPAPCASGSGAMAALAAMLAGKGALAAVGIAAGLDMATGGVRTFMAPTGADTAKEAA